MAQDQLRLSPTERANLVAYLDGELNDAESRAIATKLTNSATARRELELLEKTWELLEHLPRPRASEQLTTRTLTQMHLIAQQGGQMESAFRALAQRVGRVAAAVGASLAACLLGYALTQWVWPNPTARLARDLPLVEHLDEYRDVGSFEFLEALAESPEFNADRD
jgi:anti-sigma factor RsiW